MLNERKLAQVAAFFLAQAGGRMSVLKLVKLMYLAERKAIEDFSHPMIWDSLVSMDHGPVPSNTLNFINGMKPTVEGGWDAWIAGRSNHDVELRADVGLSEAELDEISPAEMDVLHETWARFKKVQKWDLVEWTHQNLPEWTDPGGSSYPITYEQIFRALGVEPEEARQRAEAIEDQRRLSKLLA